MRDEAGLKPLEAGTLAAVRRVLDGLPAGHGLEARFEANSGLSVVPVVTLHRVSDGLRHTVHAQVYDTDIYTPVVGVGRTFYKSRDIGEGFTSVLHDDIAHGTNHEQVTPAFEAEFAAVLSDHLDAFDPVFPSGVAGHPLAAEMVAAARSVADAHNASCGAGEELTLALNANGQADDCNDVVSFVREDGAALPLVLRSGIGRVDVIDADSGETYANVQVHHRERLKILPEVIAHNLQDMLSASPSP